MKLVFGIYKYFPYSGLALDMIRIANECVKRNHEVVIYTRNWQGKRPHNLKVVELPNNGFTNHAKAALFHRALLKQIKGQNFDLSIGFNKIPNLDYYYNGDYCFLAHSHKNKNLFYRLMPRHYYFSRFERAVFGIESKTKIFSLSLQEKKVFQQHYLTADERFIDLPAMLEKEVWREAASGPSRDEIRSRLGIDDDVFLLLFVGSGFERKGLDRAIRGLASLPVRLKDKAMLCVVGQDRSKSFQELAELLGVGKQVCFLGGRNDVPLLMKAGDMLLHPARAELAGGVILEAIVSGLPVLVTSVCGYAWHVNASKSGCVLARSYSQSELNQTLRMMMESENLGNWKKNALEYAKEPSLYSMANTVATTFEKHKKEALIARPNKRDNSLKVYLKRELKESFEREMSFDELMNIEGQVYRIGPGRRTSRFQRNDKDYFIKMHTGVGWKEIIKNLSYLRAPVVGAANEWQGIHHLNDIGIDTMTVAAYGYRGRNPATKHSFIVTEALPTETSLEDFCVNWHETPPKTKKDLRLKRWILNKVTRTAKVMHESGMNHRDFYLCHFLLNAKFDQNDQISPDSKLYVIDLHRIKVRKKTPQRWLVKDVAGLYYSSMNIGLSQRDLFRFMKGYSGKSLRATLSQDGQFWRKVEARATKLFENEKFKTMIAQDVRAKGDG